jgi:hypothetical protein
MGLTVASSSSKNPQAEACATHRPQFFAPYLYSADTTFFSILPMIDSMGIALPGQRVGSAPVIELIPKALWEGRAQSSSMRREQIGPAFGAAEPEPVLYSFYP